MKIDQLIEKFKEFKEELNKAICSHTGKDAKLCPKDCPCKKDMEKNVNMSYATQPNATTGTSGGQGGMYKQSAGGGQDIMMMSKNGQWSLGKVDPQENVNIPHPKGKAKMAVGVNKGEAKVMEMAPEKEMPKADVKGKPYTPEAKKAEEQRDQNMAPGRHAAHGI